MLKRFRQKALKTLSVGLMVGSLFSPVGTTYASESDIFSEAVLEGTELVKDKKAMVNYLLVDSSKITEETTIDSIMNGDHSEVFTQMEYESPMYKNNEGDYLVLANVPFKNGWATQSPQSYSFTRANYNGEEITEGVSFDTENQLAVIDESAMTKNDNDYADIQMQVMVPVEVGATVNPLIAVHNDNVKVSTSYGADEVLDTLDLDPYQSPEIQLTTQETAKSVDKLVVKINGEEALSEKGYSFNKKTGVLTINYFSGMIKTIEVSIKRNASGGAIKNALGLIKPGSVKYLPGHTNGGESPSAVLGWLADGTDPSAFKVGQEIVFNAELSPYEGVNTPASILAQYGSKIGQLTYAPDDTWAYQQNFTGSWAYIGIPNNLFGVDFTFRDENGKALGSWNSSKKDVNGAIQGYCHHNTLALAANGMLTESSQATIQVLSKQTSGDVTTVVFGVETNQGIYPGPGNATQSLGCTFKLSFKESKGKLTLKKSSANKTYTDGNKNYSLEGAKYGVYKSESDAKASKNSVGTLTTDASGNANTLELEKGTYYVKETAAPKGYAKDTKVYTAKVEAGKDSVTTVNVSDKPQKDPIAIVLKKQDADINKDKQRQGDASLEGAEYTIKFYAGNDASGNPTDTWVVKTDKDGYAELSKNYLVSGNIDKYIDNGEVFLPLGVVTVQETKAPKGYLLNDKIYTSKITSAGDNEYVETFNIPVTPETVMTGKFDIYKIVSKNGESSISKPEQGAEFTAVLKRYVEKYGSVEEAIKHKDEFTKKEWSILKTGADGRAQSGELAYGTYVVKQTGGQAEVERLGQPFEVTISKNNDSHSYTINNVPSLYYLRIAKKDAKTGELVVFNSASFKIKKEDGTYVSQKVGSKKYDTFMTSSANGKSKGDGVFYVKDEDSGTAVTPLQLEAGTYTIEETGVPTGFLQSEQPLTIEVKAQNVTETDDDDKNFITVEVLNEQPTGTLIVNKSIEEFAADKSFVNREDLSGIEFTLFAKEDIINAIDGTTIVEAGKAYGTYNLNADGTLTVENIPLGNYTLKETKTTSGLVQIQEGFSVSFTQQDLVTKVYTVQHDIVNQTTKVELSKKDAGGSEVPGATIQLLDKDGNIVDEWVSGDKPHVIEGLEPGEYIMHEEVCPNGYTAASDIPFTVESTGEVQTVEMVDVITRVNKVDQLGDAVSGAELNVYEKETGVSADSWTTGRNLIKLSDEDKATLNETGEVRKDGSALTIKMPIDEKGTDSSDKNETEKSSDKENKEASEDEEDDKGLIDTVVDGVVDFFNGDNDTSQDSSDKDDAQSSTETTSSDEDSITTDESSNSVIEAVVKKVDDTQYVLTVTEETTVEKDGEVSSQKTYTQYDVDENGNETSHRVYGLQAGKTYVVTETSVPKGYAKAKDVEFSIDENAFEDINLTVVDDKEIEIGTKATIDGKKEVAPKGEVELIDTVEYKGLTPGKEYVVKGQLMDKETKKALDIDGATAETTFVPEKENGTVEVTFKINTDKLVGKDIVVFEDLEFNGQVIAKHHDIKDKDQTVKIKKVDTVGVTKYDATNQKELPGAHLKVTDKDGKVIDEWVSTEEEHLIENLIVGEKYTLTEEIAPKNYKVAESITFEVEDNGEVVQKVAMYDELLGSATKVNTGNAGLIGVVIGAAIAGLVYALKRRKQ